MPAVPVDVRPGEPARNAAWRHPLGTDSAGRDVFVRLLWGGRISLSVGLLSALLLVVIGTLFGALAGWCGGWVDLVVSRLIEVLQSFPTFVLVLAASALVPAGRVHPVAAITLLIAFVGWTGVARLVRAEFLRLRGREFVLAAWALGRHPVAIVVRHVLPAAAGPVLVAGAFAVAWGILLESAVSFLGFGVRVPVPSWGAVLSESRVPEHWWIQVFPGLLIFLTVLCCQRLGEALRTRFDPRDAGRRLPEGRVSAARLEVRDLSVEWPNALRPAVERVSFDLAAGDVLALIGASGSGKSSLASAVPGLAAADGARVRGSVRLDGRELIGLRGEALRRLRGAEIGFVFQDPSATLDPVMRVGEQVAEVLRTHRGLSRAEAAAAAVASFRRVGLPDAERRVHDWPHQLSGGMRQRVAIAMAVACEPGLILADEPTTSLDPPLAVQIQALLRSLVRESGAALLIVTHDLGTVARLADAVGVLAGGKLIEHGPVANVLERPRHELTRRLLADRPGGAPLAGRPSAGGGVR